MSLHNSLPTVQIADGDGDYLVINERDFDPEQHKLFGEDAPDEAPTELTPLQTLLAINGIGPASAKLLQGLGIEDATALAAADPAEIAERANDRRVSADIVIAWQAQLTPADGAAQTDA